MHEWLSSGRVSVAYDLCIYKTNRTVPIVIIHVCETIGCWYICNLSEPSFTRSLRLHAKEKHRACERRREFSSLVRGWAKVGGGGASSKTTPQFSNPTANSVRL